MAPEEVRGLQALAESHGGSLTINPETGLPEAGFLKKLLPTIIGFGLTYLSGGMINPMTAGMIVGGVETVRTGDLGKGISAGLGAYGGAGLGAGLAGAGANAMTTAGVEGYAEQLAARGLVPGTEAFGQAASEMALKSQADALATPFADRLSAGFDAATASPQAATSFVKDNAKNLMYAAGPAVLAGANVESKLPQTVTKPGMIRPYSYDPYGGTYEAGVPYEATANAAEGGLMGMADGGYNPGVLDFAQRSEPVVRMASGGIASFADGGGIDPAEAEKRLNSINEFLRTNPSAEAVTAAQAQYGVSPEELAAAKNYGYQRYESINKFLDTNPSNDALASAQQQYGVNDKELAAARQYRNTGAPPGTPGVDTSRVVVGGGGYDNYQMPGGTVEQGYSREWTPEQRLGINQAYIRSQTDPDYGVKGLMADMEKTGVTAKDIALSYGTDPNTVNQYLIRGGASAEFGGINKNWDTKKQDDFIKWQNLQPNPYGQGTLGDMYKAQGISDNDPIRRAQAQEQIEREERRRQMRADATTTAPKPDGDTTTPKTDTDTTKPKTDDDTVTVTPDIPGRPDDGFTGVADVRNTYTAGGGSLGYTPYAPTSMADFDAKYNTQTGGSKQEYDYLTGKTKYSPTPYTPTGEIMKPYYESVGGVPANIKTKKYLFKDGKYILNPDYEPLSYDDKGNRVTGSSTTQAAKGFEVLKPAQTQTNFDYTAYLKANPDVKAEIESGNSSFGSKNDPAGAAWNHYTQYGKKEGRSFTTIAGAKPADDVVFEWADANKVSDQQLATLMGISVAEVTKRRKNYKKPAPSSTVETDTQTAKNGGLMGYAAGGMALGGLGALAAGGSASQYNLGGYSDGGRLLRGPGDGVSDSIPASIGNKRPARLADGEFVVPARIVSELGNGSTEAGARKLYAMMDRVQKARGSTTGKGRVAKNSRADKYLPA
jgi:hypothetical protein